MAQLTHSLSIRKLSIAFLLTVFATAFAAAQDIKLNVTYVCNGERIYVESCNIRDTSDTSTCQVAHHVRPQHNGFMAYTSETRGNLKKLLPTCTQPTAAEIAKAGRLPEEAAGELRGRRREGQPAAAAASRPPIQLLRRPGRPAQERGGARHPPLRQFRPPACHLHRKLAAGRVRQHDLLHALRPHRHPCQCRQRQTRRRPRHVRQRLPGHAESGWRPIDFVDGGVLVNCGSLSPNQEAYSLAFRSTGAVLTINTTPKPLVLNVRADGTIVGPPGPVTINGVVASGYVSGTAGTGATQKDQYGNLYDAAGNRVAGNANTPGYSTFSPRQATCPAINLSKSSGAGIQTMQTNLLKSVFNDGDSGPPTPTGIRMRGIFAAASTGFSLQFYPGVLSILGCGPDLPPAPTRIHRHRHRRGGAAIKIDSPDHPLTVAFHPDGSLDPGSGSYQVHGRIVTGQNDDGDFTFAPMEQTCNLAVLSPAKEIPSTGGAAATMVASAATPATASANNNGRLSTPQAPLGNATLAIVSGLAGTPNPLGGRPYILLRDTYDGSLAKAGIAVPSGTSALKYVGMACGGPTKSPDCPKIIAAINASAASAVRSDASGSGTFPGVPPGTYYLMISAVYNQQPLVWTQPVQLKPGANSLTLNPANATPLK